MTNVPPYEIPFYVTLVVVFTVITVAVVIWYAIGLLGRRIGMPENEVRRMSLGFGIGFAVWMLLAPAASSAMNNVLPPINEGAPNVGTLPIILTPLVIGIVLVFVSPRWRAMVQAVPQPWLIAFQFYRNVGFVFLVLHSLGQLPAYFAYPAGYGDLIAGLPTPFLAYYAWRRASGWRTTTVVWNFVGLLDFIVAVGIGSGIMYSGLSVTLFNEDQLVTAMFSQFPMALIPMFVVPIGITLHVYSLLKLYWERSEAEVTHSSHLQTAVTQ